jgi:phosphopentomutase
MTEQSQGKDTTTGHWEMMGLILKTPFRVYSDGFPPEIVDKFVQTTGREVLGNKAASGTEIIMELGEEHIKTGKWILYTSADSVFQLAAHEEKVPLAELYDACKKARELLNSYRVGRVIARPFVGRPGSFERTYNRHDFSMKPDGPTVLTALHDGGIEVIGIGKIHDIYAGVGISRSIPTSGNRDGLEGLKRILDEVKAGLVFINLVDFDMRFGHRRDPSGYAQALEEFDGYLNELLPELSSKDLLLITADHGCDPTFTAHTDHTREYVPILMYSTVWQAGKDLGVRETFADVGATVAQSLGIAWNGQGRSLLPVYSII